MNPLFNTFNHFANSGNMVSQFMQFMNQCKGQNPSQIIQSMISSGKLTQDQLQQVQQKAQQMESQFEGFKQSFGFK